MASRRQFSRQPEPAPVAPDPEEPVEVSTPPAPVAPAASPPPTAPASEPSGLVVVRVRGPGGVLLDVLHEAGAEIVLTRTDAESLGDAVEIVG